jgi:hypothetical protein
MTTLGELTKLLDQGCLTGEYIHTSTDGSYTFELKTVTPLEELQATKDAAKYDAAADEYDMRVYNAIETLARCVTRVNGIELEKLPVVEGTTSLDKRRSVIKRLSETLLIGLWTKYQEIKKGTTLQGTKEEADVVKK